MNSLSDIVNHANISVIVGLVDVWKFQSGAGMAAIKDDEESTRWRHPRDEMLVQCIGIDLPVLAEIHGTDGIENCILWSQHC